MSISYNTLYKRYKKMYDPMYTFSLCLEEEIDEVVSFIDTYWKKGHALVKSRLLLDWQYKNYKNHTYNFIIARSKDTNKIHAIEGFIPTTQFDDSIKNAMTWGTIWKSIPEVAPLGLGFVVKQYREEVFGTKYNCEVGISPDALKYNTQLGNAVYSLTNWYIVNPLKKDFNLIETVCKKSEIPNNSRSKVNYRMMDISDWNRVMDSLIIPEYKSGLYYVNRYFKHPIYKYYSILLSDMASSGHEVIFYRIAEHDGNKCIFIVDYIGDGTLISESQDVLITLMKENDAEYILFPCYGVPDCYLKKAGFVSRKQINDIIPIYYEPFVKQNVEILCASRNSSVDWCSFKGDSDQDRPNIIVG